jgi:hypothetical protein
VGGASGGDSHRAAYDDGSLRITLLAAPGSVALAGEVDEDNCPGMATALEQLAAGAAELRIDLAQLAFCDLAGLRVLVGLTTPGAGPAEAGPGAAGPGESGPGESGPGEAGPGEAGPGGSVPAPNGAGGARRVVLDQVPRPLTALLGILGWDGTPGLRVIAAGEGG